MEAGVDLSDIALSFFAINFHLSLTNACANINVRALGEVVFEAGRESIHAEFRIFRECQDFCVWGGYSRGSPTRLPFVFEMQYARPDAIAREV